MTTDPYDDPDALPEPPAVRRLRVLVTVLTIVLIVGVVTVVGALVIRLARPEPLPRAGSAAIASLAELGFPDALTVTGGDRIVAIGLGGNGRLIVVVETLAGAQSVLVVASEGGKILDRLDLPLP